jgi:peptidoglycan/xylan/chitin deacetylase (PgdA/CDA1 family)
MRAIVAGGAMAAAWSLPALAPLVPSVAGALGIERRLAGADGAIAITFDDGPHAQGTPAILETLRRAGVPATFFLTGEQVDRHRSLAAEIAAAGHRIAIHGYRHRNLLRLSPRQVEDDLARAAESIGAATGERPTAFRPPYGIFSPAALVIVRWRGWKPVLWSRWGRDWSARATPASIAERASAGLSGGDVLLLHDADHYSAPGSWRATAAGLGLILDRIEGAGLRAVALA